MHGIPACDNPQRGPSPLCDLGELLSHSRAAHGQAALGRTGKQITCEAKAACLHFAKRLTRTYAMWSPGYFFFFLNLLKITLCLFVKRFLAKYSISS